MKISFTKMQALGNDFMVVDDITQPFSVDSQTVIKLSNRYTGIGFDQLLLVSKALDPSIDFSYHIYNSDGSKVQQCGNGARCVALFVVARGLTKKRMINIATQTAVMQLKILAANRVAVSMGQAVFTPEMIPFKTHLDASALRAQPAAVEIQNISYKVSVLSVGNPHVVVRVDDVDSAPLATLAAAFQAAACFPQQVNVGMLQVINASRIKLRVYERGSGETRACGSGAVAAAVAGVLHYGLDETVHVIMLGGQLKITYCAADNSIIMDGEAKHVFNGVIEL